MKNIFILLKISALLVLLTGFTRCSTARSVETHPALIDGKPQFIIGIYHNPKKPEELKALADNGFNLVRCSASSKELDMAHKAGLYAWLNTGYAIDFSKDKEERKKKLTELVNNFKNHPALAAWEVPDEALWNLGYPGFEKLFYGFNGNKWSVERQDSILKVLSEAIKKRARGFEEGIKYLKSLDPFHPVWMNHAPRNTHSQLKLFSKPADIIGCDIYPGYKGIDGHNELHSYRLNSVGAYTDIMKGAAPGKPVWMVLPAFSWDFLRQKHPTRENLDPENFPTYKDSRFMAWNAILHGAEGILYWGSSFRISPKSLFWKSISGVTKEIAALEPFLVSKELKSKIKIDPIQFTSAVKTRYAYTLRKHNDDYLLVVQQEDLGQAVNVSGLEFMEGKTLYELTTGMSYVVKNGTIRIRPRKDTHVLCTSKKYEVVKASQYPARWDKDKHYPLNEK